MSVSRLSTDQQEYGTSGCAAWNWTTRKTVRHKEDNLAGDMMDPTSNNRLHCVLEAVITSSEPCETISTESFIGDRAQAEDNPTCDAIDPHRNTRPHSVLKFLRSWLPLELAVQHQKKGDLDELSGVHLDSGQKLGEPMLAPSGTLKIVSSTDLCMLASEDHASHDARTTEAGKIFELMRAFFAAASFDRGLQVSVL